MFSRRNAIISRVLDFCRKLTGKKAKAITAAVTEQTAEQADIQPTAAAPVQERPPRRQNAEYSRHDSARPGRPPRERFDASRSDQRSDQRSERRHDAPRPRRDTTNAGPKLNPDHRSEVLPALRVISRDQHSISRKDISPSALKVLYRLNDAGFEAYLVGGCIRDLLLGLIPKDFDVVTNATPDEVRTVFKNCRLIGRRFRLAHVVFGREVIEVATFRGHHSAGEEEENIPAGVRSDHGQNSARQRLWHHRRRRRAPRLSASTPCTTRCATLRFMILPMVWKPLASAKLN